MAAHKNFTIATEVSVYFCDPKSPWQSGTSENTNRLFCGSTCPEGPSFRCTIKPTST
jgi:IS30 family transposase